MIATGGNSEWNPTSAFNHSRDSIELNSWTARFFVNECRKSLSLNPPSTTSTLREGFISHPAFSQTTTVLATWRPSPVPSSTTTRPNTRATRVPSRRCTSSPCLRDDVPPAPAHFSSHLSLHFLTPFRGVFLTSRCFFPFFYCTHMSFHKPQKTQSCARGVTDSFFFSLF